MAGGSHQVSASPFFQQAVPLGADQDGVRGSCRAQDGDRSFFSPQGNCPGCMLYFFVVLLDGNLGFIEVVYRLSFPYIVFFIISYHHNIQIELYAADAKANTESSVYLMMN